MYYMKTIFQAYNPRIKAWVKYKIQPDKTSRIVQVKKVLPTIPFKNVPTKGK